MLFLKLGEPMVIDGSYPFAVRVAGLQAGDGVEVSHGPAGSEQVWQTRSAPLPWLRATPTPGEFMVDTNGMDTQVTFLATMAERRAVGATVVQMGETGQTWSHPGATARAGERWAFLTLATVDGQLTVTARDEPAGRDSAISGGLAGADTATAIVDISASMQPAVTDGRLVAALAAAQAAAARSRLSAVTTCFVGGDVVHRVVLPVTSSPADALNEAVSTVGWRTGTSSGLLAALPETTRTDQVAWIISDSVPDRPTAPGVGFVDTGAASGPAASHTVHLSPGESTSQLADRLIAAVLR